MILVSSDFSNFVKRVKALYYIGLVDLGKCIIVSCFGSLSWSLEKIVGLSRNSIGMCAKLGMSVTRMLRLVAKEDSSRLGPALDERNEFWVLEFLVIGKPNLKS